jgi:hypothetical protein
MILIPSSNESWGWSYDLKMKIRSSHQKTDVRHAAEMRRTWRPGLGHGDSVRDTLQSTGPKVDTVK